MPTPDRTERPQPREAFTRRQLLAGVAGVAVLAGCANGSAETAARSGTQTPGEWADYAGDKASTRYSPLDQIDAGNVVALEIVWEWRSPDEAVLAANPDLAPGEFQATPIMAGGLLYTSTAMCQVAAIDPASGTTVWVHDPQTWRHGPPTSKGFQHRGVAYWRDGEDARVIIATGDNRLIALNARTGELIRSFGEGGEVDLAGDDLQRPLSADRRDVFGSTSPPAICRDTIIVGQYIHDRSVQQPMPPGDVRGYNVRTGRRTWTFHTIPRKGEAGYETWLDGSAERSGNANIWAPISTDEELGLVYLPGSCPTNNFFGGDRPGDNLFGNALIALDAETGERRWHFQIVHHDIWDYDLPCAPILLDVEVEGRPVKAVAQLTKHGFCFVFDRATGEPVWPIEERPAPPSLIAAERAAPTQPHPTRPPPFERQGLSEADLIDYTPELLAEAKTIMGRYNAGPLFTPTGPTPTTVMPGWVGGANWGGGAADPDTGLIYVPSVTLLVSMALGQDGTRLDAGDAPDEIAGRSTLVLGPRGLPLIKPPYGRITAIDLKSGTIAWQRANGPGGKDSAAFAPYNPGWIGTIGRTGPLATRTLLFMGEGPHDPRFARKVLRAYDKASGDVVAEIALPDHTLGPPMTYMAGGRQFIVCGMGFRGSPHRLVALALPAAKS
jgi:quinoprotein glucose dehydrogenase